MDKLSKAMNEFPTYIFPWNTWRKGKVACDIRQYQDVYYYKGYYVPANKMFVQRKTHKKKRINKKWLNRYGYDLLDFPKEFFEDLNNRIKDFGEWIKQDLARDKEIYN